MTEKYDLEQDIDIDVLRDNVLVKRLVRKTEYTHGEEILLPEEWVDKSPKQAKYGVVIDWGDFDPVAWRRVKEEDDDKEMHIPGTADTKEWLDDKVEPLTKVASFSRGRHLKLGTYKQQSFSFVKMANLLWLEDYDSDTFADLEEEKIIHEP